MSKSVDKSFGAMSKMDFEKAPESVEEAGALLGATITFYGAGTYKTISPPKGTHSSFSTISPTPSSELFERLHTLRGFLRSASKDEPLVAAPSLIAGVLMKLLGVSNKLASSTNVDPTRRIATPPMLSTPLRKLWVDCIVLCHSLGEGLSGNARINIYGFVRNMISLAALNPRTAKAAGGTRIAALEAIEGIMKDPKLSIQLASWAFDVTHLCQRAQKSSGNGEPSYRVAAVRTACSVVIASRNAFMKTRPLEGSEQLILKGALDDKAIFEMVKLLKTAVNDKFVEVRAGAATLAGLLAPLVIHLSIKSPRTPEAAAASPTASLEDIMTLAFKNLDDASPECASAWADALARSMSTAIEFGKQLSAEKTSRRNVDGGNPAPSAQGKGKSGPIVRKGVLGASNCSTLPKTLKYLVSFFVTTGGDLVAPRAGGSFSVGGRSVRLGFARALIQLLRLQTSMQSIGEGKTCSHKEAILIILSMVGTDMERQLANEKVIGSIESLDATSVMTASTVREPALSVTVSTQPSGNTLFGQAPKVSHADAGIARLATSRVLREGILDLAPETIQLAILHEFVDLCVSRQGQLKGNQLQVILIEMSHLFARLGEAASSSLEELTPALVICLCHPDHGVRHEAAVLCAAVASAFPSQGRRLVEDNTRAIQEHHAELMAIAASNASNQAPTPTGGGRFRFGRRASPTKKKDPRPDQSLKAQYAIHGMGLMVTMILRDLPNLPGGLPVELLDDVMSVTEILCSTYFNDVLTRGSPSGVCTCVRAGFAMMCGILATGPGAIVKHIERIFETWEKMSKLPQREQSFTTDHILICVEAMLSSILSFLINCSELLLSVPDSLSRITLVLEGLLPQFYSNGELGEAPINPVAASRLDIAKASIMEAFSWLPPGSYPMIADSLFAFAAINIQIAVESDVSCSLLHSLISREDKILDSRAFCRASLPGQVGGLRDLERDIIARTSEIAHHGDRESALYFFTSGNQNYSKRDCKFLYSRVLGMCVHAYGKEKPPTVLHEIGTWHTPVLPSSSAKVRLVDAAIQAFAATFCLKGEKEQLNAIKMLESMVPPINFQASRGMAGALSEQNRRGKSKEYRASYTNVTAVLVSCLRAQPIQESTHNVPIGIVETWMTKAKDVLLDVFPSRSPFVRRAAAEGLAFISTLGVKEDAHFLQSAILHSLDEVIRGKDSTGETRSLSPESMSAASATALLTYACIQRTSQRIKLIRADRSRIRGSADKQQKGDANDMLPILQIMIRVLPSTNCGVQRGFFGVRAYALHAFGLLIAYSNKLRGTELDPDAIHILKKIVGTVEDNFLAAWTVASSGLDHGNEAEKLAMEPCFLSVLLRLMTFLLPSLHHLGSFDSGIAARFSKMATLIIECSGSHPMVDIEALAFYEVLSKHRQLLPPHSGGLKYDENPLLCCIPFLMNNLTPDRSLVHPIGGSNRPSSDLTCTQRLKGTLIVIKALSLSQILVAEWSDLKIVSLLLASLEDTLSSRLFAGEITHRSLAVPRESESFRDDTNSIESELLVLVRLLIYLERSFSESSVKVLFRYILLSKSLLIGASRGTEDDDDDAEVQYTLQGVTQAALQKASIDAGPVLNVTNQVRWQVKSLVAQMTTIALHEITAACNGNCINSSSFNPELARLECLNECQKAAADNSPLPESKLAFHIPAMVTMACVTATATVDQSELNILQECAVPLLSKIMTCFGSIQDPEQPDNNVLHDHIPQISSCIKGALGAPGEYEGAASCRLFMVGCESLREFLRSQVTCDTGVLKRIIRPALPASSEVPFFAFGSENPLLDLSGAMGDPQNKIINKRSNLLIQIGKLWTLGNIPLNDPEINKLLEADKESLGVHCAALTIDGARLLLASKMSLSGKTKESDESQLSCQYGITYGHIDDIDDFVKAALVEKWAACGSIAVTLLADAISADSDKKAECIVWLQNIVPLLFAGLNDSIPSSDDDSSTSSEKIVEWGNGIDVSSIACSCIEGINALVIKSEVLGLDKQWLDQVKTAMAQVSDLILLPALSSSSDLKKESSSSSDSSISSAEVVAKSCVLLQSLTDNSSVESTNDSSLLLALLGPLNRLSSGSVNILQHDSDAALVVSTCLVSVSKIVSKPTTTNTLVKAMLNLVFTFPKEKETPQPIITGIQLLLRECLQHPSITLKEQSSFATTMAKHQDLENWSVIVQASAGLATQHSFSIIKKILLDPSRPHVQLDALRVICQLVQGNTGKNPLVGRVFCAVGAEILSVFQTFANKKTEQRTAVCADCMKIALASFKQFVSDDELSDEEVAKFLVVLFFAFNAIIRFNGLPNHPLPHGNEVSDPSIGRMCAQAMTHAARTAPLPFKSSMALMPETERVVLEFAVRAEMSGYATASQAPVKKKLSLKGFRK